MPVKIIKELCNGCGACDRACPNQAIVLRFKEAEVDSDKCQDCEECVFVCPNGAITASPKLELPPASKPAAINDH